jgi:sulfotransferase family protein
MTIDSVEPNFSAPVIIIGPGRSGTTLLGSALGEHPDFYMIGETQFLVQRMWKVLSEFPIFSNYMRLSKLAQQTNPAWRRLAWYNFAMDVAGPEPEQTLGELYMDIAKAENVRLARELGASFARMMIPPSLRRRHWGMREIWIGSTAFPYSLELYEIAFPNARYLQSVRNPLVYLASNFNNRKVVATREAAIYELNQWVQMTRYARTVADTKRYLEHISSE